MSIPLRQRALAGKLPPVIEAMLWYYAKGKPTEHSNQAENEEMLKWLDRVKAQNAQIDRPGSGSGCAVRQATAEESHEKGRPGAP